MPSCVAAAQLCLIRYGTRGSDFPHRDFLPALQAQIDSDLRPRREIESGFGAGGFALLAHQFEGSIAVESLSSPKAEAFYWAATICSTPRIANSTADVQVFAVDIRNVRLA